MITTYTNMTYQYITNIKACSIRQHNKVSSLQNLAGQCGPTSASYASPDQSNSLPRRPTPALTNQIHDIDKKITQNGAETQTRLPQVARVNSERNETIIQEPQEINNQFLALKRNIIYVLCYIILYYIIFQAYFLIKSS